MLNKVFFNTPQYSCHSLCILIKYRMNHFVIERRTVSIFGLGLKNNIFEI